MDPGSGLICKDMLHSLLPEHVKLCRDVQCSLAVDSLLHRLMAVSRMETHDADFRSNPGQTWGN